MLQFTNSTNEITLAKFKENMIGENGVEKNLNTIGGNRSGWKVKYDSHVWVVVYDFNLNHWEVYNSTDGLMDCKPFKLIVKFDDKNISIICADDGGRKLKSDRSLKKFMWLAVFINSIYLIGFFQ